MGNTILLWSDEYLYMSWKCSKYGGKPSQPKECIYILWSLLPHQQLTKTNLPLDPLNTGDFSTYKRQTLILLLYKQVPFLSPVQFLLPLALLSWPQWYSFPLASVRLLLTHHSSLSTLPTPNLVLFYSWWVWLINTTQLEKVFKLENWALFIPITLMYTLHTRSSETVENIS